MPRLYAVELHGYTFNVIAATRSEALRIATEMYNERFKEDEE
jgi:hypothetical protein